MMNKRASKAIFTSAFVTNIGFAAPTASALPDVGGQSTATTASAASASSVGWQSPSDDADDAGWQ
ncbi:hypothetical protein [Streptomyces sp. NPDC048057]|uniref:hypothetical protein n=1 Tax=Streptomyces sp. NPDC048057 TaxID=3155628 RepID=UPI0033D98C6E